MNQDTSILEPCESPLMGFSGGEKPAKEKGQKVLSQNALRTPFRNFTFYDYPLLNKLHKKLSNCGHDFITLLNKDTLEEIELPLYCDNRVCLNPNCQKHRLYKFMREHKAQIRELNRDMRKPKGWVFTTPLQPYPIDRFYCREKLKELYFLLDKSKHPKYGSNSKFSIHMEIKLHEDSWYLHFHGASGGITDLRLIRKIWGAQIKYEDAIEPLALGYYISKYASKVPTIPNKRAYLEYATTTYKLQMHRFGCKVPPILRDSPWVILKHNSFNAVNTFYELDLWLDEYLNDYGFGG